MVFPVLTLTCMCIKIFMLINSEYFIHEVLHYIKVCLNALCVYEMANTIKRMGSSGVENAIRCSCYLLICKLSVSETDFRFYYRAKNFIQLLSIWL